jgi:hypothetical protein
MEEVTNNESLHKEEKKVYSQIHPKEEKKVHFQVQPKEERKVYSKVYRTGE